MIKMGKIKVNPNVSTKTYIFLTLFSIILLVLFGGYTISNYIKTKDYIKLNATITYVGTEYINESDSTERYIEYKYEYEDKTYTNKQRVSFSFNKKVGNIQNVYVNPDNPNEVKDTYNTNATLVLSIVMLIVTMFLIKAYNVRKNMK